MKKFIFLFFTILFSSVCFSQLNENFDATTTPPDDLGNWVLSSGTWLVKDNMGNGVPTWEYSSDNFPGYQGGKAAIIQRQNTGAGVLSQEWLIAPLQNISANKQLRYFTSQTIPGDQGTIYQVRVSSNPNPLNFNSYAVLATFTETQLSTLTASQVDYEEKIHNLNFTGTFYIAFVKIFTQPGAALGGDRWLIDNVRIVDKCTDPTQLGVTAITTQTATFNWTGNAASYTLEYGPQGFIPNTGAGTLIPNLPTPTYTTPLGTLTPFTNYDFYVTAVCAQTSSAVTGPFFFRTLAIGSVCADPIVVGSLPYFQTSATNLYGDNINVPFIDDTNCGVNNFYFIGDDVVYAYTAPATTSGIIDIFMNPLGGNHSAVFVYATCVDIGETCLASQGDWGSEIRKIQNFAILPGQTIYIVLSSSAFNTSINYSLTIQEGSCTSPSLLSSIATGVGSVDLSWQQETGIATSWEVYVQNAGAGFPPGPGVSTTTNTNFSVSSLTSIGTPLAFGTQYQYWVRAACTTGGFSSWVGPYIFSTAPCADFCYYDFVMTDSAGNGWDATTMKVIQNGLVIATIGSDFNDGFGPFVTTVPLCNGPFEVVIGGYDLEYIDVALNIINPFNQNILAYDYIPGALWPGAAPLLYSSVANCDAALELCLPPVDLLVTNITTDSAQLSWTAQGNPPLSWDVYVVTAGSPAPLADTVPTLNTIANPITINTLTFDTAYEYYVRAVCDFAGPNIWSPASSVFTTLEFCNKPTNVILVNASLDSLEFDWTNGGTETEWQYFIQLAGLPVPSDTDSNWVTTLAHPLTIGGLLATTAYDFYVRSICSPTLFSNPTEVVTENTILCTPEQQCLYTFTMSDFDGNGWVLGSNLMTVSQNGIAIATIGSTFSSGTSATVQIPLCDAVPFELFWTQGFSFQGTGIKITNPAGQVVYNKPFGVGLPGTSLFEGTAVCSEFPSCNQPTNVFVSSSGVDSVTVSWQENNSPPATSWDIIVLPATSPAPLQIATNWINVSTNTNYIFNGLTAGTLYKVYVRSVCSSTEKSFWSTGTTFSTLVCAPNDVCDYTFVMGDSIDNSWSNNTIQIIQNGIVVYTLTGPELGQATDSVVVSLCNNTPFELFWNNVGLLVNTVSLDVVDPSGTVVYDFEFEEAVDLNLYGTLFYTGTTNCIPNSCAKPIQLYTTNATDTTITLAWSEAGTATQYEVFILTAGSPAPLPTAVGIPATNPYTFVGTTGIQYKFFVRAICSAALGEISGWSLPQSFNLILPNDNCSNPTIIPVNDGVACNQTIPATLTGATGSSQISTCDGSADDDVWFQFTATSLTHAITIQNFSGSNNFFPLTVAVYTGSNCNNLTTVLCEGKMDLVNGQNDIDALNQSIVLKELTPGTIYLVRIYSTNNTPNQNITFDLCVTTLPTAVAVSLDLYTPEQLVTDILTNSDCSSVSNVTFSTGTNFNSNNGIGYFTQNNSSFPFADGIVLSTGIAANAPGPNVDISQNPFFGQDQWPGDADLNALLLAQGVPNTTKNATVLEFDFIPLTNSISFDFLFASDEYGIFQCFFSDVFAFILTNTQTNVSTNLAVIPNTAIPVSATTIRDNTYNTDCSSENAAFFDSFYSLPLSENPLLAPINFTGTTVPMTAFSTVVPGQLYHIKLAIADYSDFAIESAVFLKGGSFDLGSVNLGPDLVTAENTAVCPGETIILNSQLTNEFYAFEWKLGDSVITDATNSTLTVTQPGTYMVTAIYDNSICQSSDTIIVEFYNPIVVGPVTAIVICNSNPTAIFNLTPNGASALQPLDANHAVLYFASQAALDAGVNIENPETYTSSSNPQTIFIKVTNTVTGCSEVVNFIIGTEDLAPQFTLPADIILCNGTSQTIAVMPINFDLASVTYAWTIDGNPLPDTTSAIVASLSGVYEVTITQAECTSSQSIVVELGTSTTPTFDLATTYCQLEEAELLPLLSDNSIAGTWSPATINTSIPGDFEYVYTSSAENCNVTYVLQVTVTQQPVFTIAGRCENNDYKLTATPQEGFDASDVLYQWSDAAENTVNNGNEANVVIANTGDYVLEVIYNNCTTTFAYTVDTVLCKIQKGISPNGDSDNEFFELDGFNVTQLTIFNRYGTEVYSKKNYSSEWNGQSNKGDELPSATYFYVMEQDGFAPVSGWIFVIR
jgi:gliding motility-associated-like protein